MEAIVVLLNRRTEKKGKQDMIVAPSGQKEDWELGRSVDRRTSLTQLEAEVDI